MNEEDVKSKASAWALENADETMATNSALNRGFIGGYMQHAKENENKIFTLEDVTRYHDIRCTQGGKKADEYIELIKSTR